MSQCQTSHYYILHTSISISIIQNTWFINKNASDLKSKHKPTRKQTKRVNETKNQSKKFRTISLGAIWVEQEGCNMNKMVHS